VIIKKFQGKTEEEATVLAKNELGSGAVIMNVKTLKKKGFFAIFKPAMIEVTAAVEEESDNPPAIKPAPSVIPVTRPSFPGVIMDDEEKTEEAAKTDEKKESDIEARLESLHSLIEEKLIKSDDNSFDEKEGSEKTKAGETVQFFKLIYNTLIENEVDERYANDLMGEIEKINRPGATMDYILSNIYQRMILKFGQASTLTSSVNGPKVVYFVGPTGVGKTTTIAKIASIFSVNEKKKVALLTTDTYRIAAAEQLRTYANILNVPFRIVYTVDEMQATYKEFTDYDYILVDTAGHSPRNAELKEGTRQFLNALDGLAEKEVYLVISATTKYRDLIKIADMYREMSAYKLIFTKLDETEYLGNLWNLKQYTGASMSYITCGQNVPDDISTFNPQTTVKQLLGGK